MSLTGQSFLGSARTTHAGAPFHAINPATNLPLQPAYSSASLADVDRAALLAAQAFPVYSELSGKSKAVFLLLIADGLDANGTQIIARANLETALPLPRLTGELARTTGQLRLFATLVEEGSWVDARIDSALPDRKPQPRPLLRSMLRPIGPVVVFGASNFPLAFSAAGGDTASALAAGCPVIVKAHPAHPGTSELVAEVIQQSIAASGLPEGVFSLLFDAGFEVGAALVKHPAIQAVGFTGSHSGGRALMDIASSRPHPIPCFTEMSSGNPIFILPGALSDPSALAQNLFASFTLGGGQFCTKPGIVFLPEHANTESFLATLSELVQHAQPFTLLTPGIARNYATHSTARTTVATLAAQAAASAQGCNANAQLFTTTLDAFLANPKLSQEIFGPDTLLVRCPSINDFPRAAQALDGHLTASLFGSEHDFSTQRTLITLLEQKAGRLILNGYPTGVEVSHAMVHGGPYPATSDARFTSVGTQAIYRFVRPVCFQNFPDALVPAELQSANPLGIQRLIDGVSSSEAFQE